MTAVEINDAHFNKDSTFTLRGQDYHFMRALPRKEKERFALDLAEASLVFDEELRIAYEGYTFELALAILTLAYYTDFDTTAFLDDKSRYELYDVFESNGVLVMLLGFISEDHCKVLSIYERVKSAAIYAFERKHSLSYLARKTLGSILSAEDLPSVLARTEEVNNTMIDLLGTFNGLRGAKTQSGGIVSFHKKKLD